MLKDYQQKQLDRLRSGIKGAYEEASIYTILLDLCKSSDINEVFTILHKIACDIEQRETLESNFEKAKIWQWTN